MTIKRKIYSFVATHEMNTLDDFIKLRKKYPEINLNTIKAYLTDFRRKIHISYPDHWPMVFQGEEIPTLDQAHEQIREYGTKRIKEYIHTHDLTTLRDIIKLGQEFSDLSQSTIQQYLIQWGDTDTFPFGWTTIFTLPELPDNMEHYVKLRAKQFKKQWPKEKLKLLKQTSLKEYNALFTTLEKTVGRENLHRFTREPRIIMEKIQKLKDQGIKTDALSRKEVCRYLSAEPTYRFIEKASEQFPFINVMECRKTARIILRRAYKKVITKRARDKAAAAIYLTHKFLTQSESVLILETLGYPTTTPTLRQVLKDLKLQRRDETQLTKEKKVIHEHGKKLYKRFLRSDSKEASKLNALKREARYKVQKTKKIPITCDFCGNLFLRHRNELGNHNFCSYACFKKWQKTKWTELTCKQCGNTFKRLHSKIDSSRDYYCSVDCFQEWIQDNPKKFGKKVHSTKQQKTIKGEH